jgi:hypothetical protein
VYLCVVCNDESFTFCVVICACTMMHKEASFPNILSKTPIQYAWKWYIMKRPSGKKKGRVQP